MNIKVISQTMGILLASFVVAFFLTQPDFILFQKIFSSNSCGPLCSKFMADTFYLSLFPFVVAIVTLTLTYFIGKWISENNKARKDAALASSAMMVILSLMLVSNSFPILKAWKSGKITEEKASQYFVKKNSLKLREVATKETE